MASSDGGRAAHVAGSAIAREQITGLVLAGGRGSRMGGLDKGLVPFEGRPLVAHAIERLAPQVGPLLINANRHAEAYAAFGVPVVADALADYPGPLAGLLAGLEQAGTEWLVSVPCDTPRFPADLVARLAASAVAAGADVALPVTREPDGRQQPQPVFCLLRRALREPLAAFLARGERKIDRFTAGQKQVLVPFERADDAAAFANANTREELAALARRTDA